MSVSLFSQQWRLGIVFGFLLFIAGATSSCGREGTAELNAETSTENLKPSDENADPIDPTQSPAEIVAAETGEVDSDPYAVSDSDRKPNFYDEFHGLEYQGYVIPHKGKKNRFLAPFGHTTEPTGKIVDMRGFFSKTDFVEGRVSWFGGPSDTGVTSKETGAITGEVLRKLNPKTFYAAMRFDYGTTVASGRVFWKKARLLVVNPKSGRAVIVRPVDWGPNPRLNRILDVSPGALSALGANTDETLWVSFAKPDSQLGLVR